MIFNYKSAWELVKPMFDNQAPEILSLYKEVCVLSVDLRQNSFFDMPFPDTLRAKFEALTDVQLAESAAVIYAYGHWHPESCDSKCLSYDHSGYWKYANYCDQVLRTRLNIPRGKHGGNKASKHLEIHEGVLRVCFSHCYFWQFSELCLATRENLEVVLAANIPEPIGRSGKEAFEWADKCKDIALLLHKRLGSGPIGCITDSEESRLCPE